MLGQAGRNVVLDWAECINMGALSRDSECNVFVQVGWKWL